MDTRLSFEKILCSIVLFYPVIHIALYLVSDGLTRKFAQLFLIFLIYAEFKLVIQTSRRRKDHWIYILMIAALIGYNWVKFGLNYIFHQDFYGFILLIFILLVFSEDKYIYRIKEMLNDEITIEIILLMFHLLIVYSVLFANGMIDDGTWGMSIPVLYGPFSVPHILSYMEIITYCYASNMFFKTDKIRFLVFMGISVICSLWTGARSGFLALAIVVFADYLRLKRVSWKVLIMYVGVIMCGYLVLFTDIINKVPMLQKTIIAFTGGSVSNGREDFLAYILNCFWNFTTGMEKAFGIGLSKIRFLMHLKWKSYIHAHNDFANILVGFGIIGFVLFIALFVRYLKKIPRWIYFAIVLFILAFTNGLYMYLAFTPSIPVLAAFFCERKEERCYI